MQKKNETATLSVDFAKGDVSSGLNWLSRNNRIQGILEGKDFEVLDMWFPLVGEFVG